MPDFRCIWDFIRRNNTRVLRGEKITKVLGIGHLGLFGWTAGTLIRGDYNDNLFKRKLKETQT